MVNYHLLFCCVWKYHFFLILSLSFHHLFHAVLKIYFSCLNKTIILIVQSNIKVGQLEKLVTNHLLVNVSLLLQLVPKHYLISLTLTFYSTDNNFNYLEQIDQSCNKITTLLGRNVRTNCNYAMFLAN